MRRDEYKEEDSGINPMQMGVAMFSPNKILVESATMIFIIAFMLLNIVVLIYKGPELGSTESMIGVMALFVTFLIAGRQYASFR
tara:strand:+ start:1389 stop:1640 length:252 start_codon:yes stop_codon:yes gene_type:complete